MPTKTKAAAQTKATGEKPTPEQDESAADEPPPEETPAPPPAVPGEAVNDTALLLAGMTGTLRYLLENGQVRHNLPATLGADLNLSSQPPDRVKVGEDEKPQINLYLYQAGAKGLAGRSRFVPGAGDAAATVPSGMETEFELSYLVTAFGASDYHWEVLQGYALAVLRENPLLPAEALRRIIRRITDSEGGRDVPPALAPLREAPLLGRLEEARLSLLAPPIEQIGQIWSLLQSRYRPTLFLRMVVTLHPAG